MPLKAICRPPLVGSLNYVRRIERISMNPLVQRLFFTNKMTINHIEVDGVFLNWFGRNVPYVVIGGWAVLVLAFQLVKA